MGKRRKGRDISGWLVVDKPAGPTSTDVVNRVRRAFDAKKAGHAGTLDPAATGVLAVAFGEATKTVPHVTDGLKTYRFSVRLGAATDTDDAEGEVIETRDARPTDDDIRAALGAYRGDILQVPPQFSAVRIDGERAYARARAGEDMVIAPRPLFVDRLDLTDRPDADTAVFEMTCGKGGYVRSIARDLGRDLGCLGHVTALRRLAAGPFDIAQSVPLSELESDPDDARLLPLESALADLPEVRCSAEAAARLRNGNPAPAYASTADYGDTAWASSDGRPVAIGTYRAGEFHPSRVFRS